MDDKVKLDLDIAVKMAKNAVQTSACNELKAINGLLKTIEEQMKQYDNISTYNKHGQ